MLIRLKKVRDGVVLSCVRAGGESVVQRTGHDGFFALHDLMHYAVETTLGCTRAFFGLLSEGWEFTSFTGRSDPRYKIVPDDAIVVEYIVAALSRHVPTRPRSDEELQTLWADEVNAELASVLIRDGLPARVLSVEELRSIAERYEGLAERWARVGVGEHLELEF